jgi:hypothetical protein
MYIVVPQDYKSSGADNFTFKQKNKKEVCKEIQCIGYKSVQ